MINRTDRITAALLTLAFILLGSGYAAALPQTDHKDRGPDVSSEKALELENTFAAECTEVTESDILWEINTSPASLKQQFQEKNITYSYADQKLVFKGFISGSANNLRALVSGFEKLRGSRCIRVISFEGAATGTNFEWRPEIDSASAPAPAKCDVAGAIDQSVGDQLNKTFFYTYDENARVLELRGHLGDAPGRGRFNSLAGKLQQLLKSGCLTRITFAPHQEQAGSGQLRPLPGDSVFQSVSYTAGNGLTSMKMAGRGFEWQVCEYPSCECAGQCKPCSDPC